MPENTPTAPLEDAVPAAPAVMPHTGEVIDLNTLEPLELAAAIDLAGELLERVHTFRRAVVAEVARRADARGKRTVTIGPVTFKVNAPTEDVYDVHRLRAELKPLLDDGTIDRELVDELIVTPDPKPPEPRVDKRRVNALLKSDDRRLLAALAASRRRVPTSRTASIVDIAVDGTAQEAQDR